MKYNHFNGMINQFLCYKELCKTGKRVFYKMKTVCTVNKVNKKNETVHVIQFRTDVTVIDTPYDKDCLAFIPDSRNKCIMVY